MSKGWKEVKLSEVTSKIGSGSTPRGGSKVYKLSGIPLIRSQNIYNCRFSENGLVFIDEVQAEKLSNVEIEEDDILLNITGDSVARCTKVPNKYVRGRVNQHVSIIRANEEILDSEYLKYHLVNRDMQEYMLSLARMGATRAALTKSMIESLEILLPPLNEQKVIAHILSTLDEKIETNNQINQRLEEIAQTIFKHWFVDFEFPNENGEPYKSGGGEMVESELGMIPKGWEVGKFENLVTVKYGKDHKKLEDGDIPVYGSGGVMRYVNKSLYSLESVLIPRKGTLNNVIYINEPFWSVDTMFFTQMNYPNITKYIYFFIKGKDLLSMNSGSAVPSMTTNILNQLPIISSPLTFIQRFNKLVEPIFLHMNLNDKQIKKLSELRDTLLPKLMSGELRVHLKGDDI